MKLNFDEPELTCDDGSYEPVVKKNFPTLEINGKKYVIREWELIGKERRLVVLRGWNERGFPIEMQCDEEFGVMLFPDLVELLRKESG